MNQPAEELIPWLRAQLDEDERVARAVPEPARSWILDGGSIHHGHPTDEVVDWVYVEGAREHIALHDPARVLAEVDAKRRRLRVLEDLLRGDPYQEGACARELIPLEALPYADRPGYREEGRP